MIKAGSDSTSSKVFTTLIILTFLTGFGAGQTEDFELTTSFSDSITEQTTVKTCQEYETVEFEENSSTYESCISYSEETVSGSTTYIFDFDNVEVTDQTENKVTVSATLKPNEITSIVNLEDNPALTEEEAINELNNNYYWNGQEFDSDSYQQLKKDAENLPVEATKGTVESVEADNRNLMAGSGTFEITVETDSSDAFEIQLGSNTGHISSSDTIIYDYEDGNVDGWSNQGDPGKQIEDSFVFEGSYSGRLQIYDGNNQDSVYGIPSDQQGKPENVKVAIATDHLADSFDDNDIYFRNSNDERIIDLRLGAEGTAGLYYHEGDGEFTTLESDPVENTWYFVEFKNIDWDTGTISEIYVDDNLEATDQSLQSTTEIENIRVNTYGTTTYSTFIDDIAFTYDTGSVDFTLNQPDDGATYQIGDSTQFTADITPSGVDIDSADVELIDPDGISEFSGSSGDPLINDGETYTISENFGEFDKTGTWTWQVNAFDSDGNEYSSSQRTLTVEESLSADFNLFNPADNTVYTVTETGTDTFEESFAFEINPNKEVDASAYVAGAGVDGTVVTETVPADQWTTVESNEITLEPDGVSDWDAEATDGTDTVRSNEIFDFEVHNAKFTLNNPADNSVYETGETVNFEGIVEAEAGPLDAADIRIEHPDGSTTDIVGGTTDIGQGTSETLTSSSSFDEAGTYTWYLHADYSADTSTKTSVSRTFEVEETVSVSTESASNILETEVTLNGNLDSLGQESDVDVLFQYRETGASSWTETSAETLSSTGSFSETVTGLNEATDYEFRAKAEYGTEEEFGDTLTFTTGESTDTTINFNLDQPDDNSVFALDTSETFAGSAEAVEGNLEAADIELVDPEGVTVFVDSFTGSQSLVNLEGSYNLDKTGTWSWNINADHEEDTTTQSSETRTFEVEDQSLLLNLISPEDQSEIEAPVGGTVEVDHDYYIDSTNLPSTETYERTFTLEENGQVTDTTTYDPESGGAERDYTDTYSMFVELEQESYNLDNNRQVGWTVDAETSDELISKGANYKVVYADPLVGSINSPENNAEFVMGDDGNIEIEIQYDIDATGLGENEEFTEEYDLYVNDQEEVLAELPSSNGGQVYSRSVTVDAQRGGDYQFNVRAEHPESSYTIEETVEFQVIGKYEIKNPRPENNSNISTAIPANQRIQADIFTEESGTFELVKEGVVVKSESIDISGTEIDLTESDLVQISEDTYRLYEDLEELEEGKHNWTARFDPDGSQPATSKNYVFTLEESFFWGVISNISNWFATLTAGLTLVGLMSLSVTSIIIATAIIKLVTDSDLIGMLSGVSMIGLFSYWNWLPGYWGVVLGIIGLALTVSVVGRVIWNG